MVFFSCEGCGQSVKKQAVEKHIGQCRSCTALSCLDCSVTFHGNDYQAHTKCITEEAKYSGKNFVAKEAKGEMKQQGWFEQVQSAIKSTNPGNHRLKKLLEQLKNYPNIPRKEAKFKNFVANSLRVFDVVLVSESWAAISKASAPLPTKVDVVPAKIESTASGKTEANGVEKVEIVPTKAEPIANGKTVEKRKAIETDDVNVKKQKTSVNASVEEVEKDADCDDSASSFSWKSAIKQNLKLQPDGSGKLKKLRKAVVKQFFAAQTDGQSVLTLTEANGIFDEKLQKCRRVKVDGNIVKMLKTNTDEDSS